MPVACWALICITREANQNTRPTWAMIRTIEIRGLPNKIAVSDLEEHYRKRSLLQRSVFPEDIAEGVYFFASDVSNKSTGNFLNVDAGNAVSFTR